MDQILIYWQEQVASCYFMLALAREQNDPAEYLTFWQEQARYSYLCLTSNRGF